MKNKRLNILLIFGIGIIGLQAQNSIHIKENAGTQTSIALSDIRKLTFPSGHLAITQTNGSTIMYTLNNLSYLSFIEHINTIKPFKIIGCSSLSLNPNPVTEQLQITYQSAQAGRVQLAIVNMQGSIIQQQTLISQYGINQTIISVAQLKVGLYICQLQNDAKLEAIKFYKK